MDGTLLRYFFDPNMNVNDTAGLLRSADGRCGAWAGLLRDVFAAQGIGSSIKEVVEAAQPLTNGFLVKNWNFGAGSWLPPYAWIVDLDVTNALGMPGQGNPDPPAEFRNHFVVSYGGRFYDPSYGGPSYASESDWENASIDGFYIPVTINGFPAAAAKKNDPNIVETLFR